MFLVEHIRAYQSHDRLIGLDACAARGFTIAAHVLAFWFQLGLDVWFFQCCRLRFNISSGFRVFPKNVGTQEDPWNTCNSWLNFHHVFSSLSPRSNGCTSAGGVGTPERCNRRNHHLEALRFHKTNESAPSPVALVKGLTSRTRAWTLDRCDLLASKVLVFLLLL